MQIPNEFSHIIGHHNAISQIVVSIVTQDENNIHNFLLVGPPGVGKTTLSKAICDFSGRNMVELNGATLKNAIDLVRLAHEESDTRIINDTPTRITDLRFPLSPGIAEVGSPVLMGSSHESQTLEFSNVTVYVDEAHRIPKRVQDELLTLISEGYCNVRERSGLKRYDIEGNIQYIFSTTNQGMLVPALRRRFALMTLSYPTEEEKHQIIEICSQRASCVLSEQDKKLISKICFSQADCVNLLDRFIRFQNAASSLQYDGGFESFLRHINYDNNGLNLKQRDCLYILSCRNEPIAKHTLAKMLNMELVDMDECIENPLIRRGFMEIGRGGRKITSAGMAIVESWRNDARKHNTSQSK